MLQRTPFAFDLAANKLPGALHTPIHALRSKLNKVSPPLCVCVCLCVCESARLQPTMHVRAKRMNMLQQTHNAAPRSSSSSRTSTHTHRESLRERELSDKATTDARVDDDAATRVRPELTHLLHSRVHSSANVMY